MNEQSRLSAFQSHGFFFKLLFRLGQAVAPNRLSRIVRLFFRHAFNLRQTHDSSRHRNLGAVRSVVRILLHVLRLQHHGIHRLHHLHGIAPCVVAAEQIAFQTVFHKSLRRNKHLRFGTAEAVNALLGVAHNKHSRRFAARACIARQPSVQSLPLQRAGVLEFVNHQVLHPRIQPLLHPAAQLGAGQHHQRRPLHIVHVHPSALAFQGGELGNQNPRQACHALLVLPGGVLGDGGLEAKRQILRSGDKLILRQRNVELAPRAFFGQQSGYCTG